MRYFSKIIPCIFFLLLYAESMAQYEESSFTRYSVKDGLSDNAITCMQQDDQGYLWIGTDAGLNRFDGKSFVKFFQGTSPLQLRSAGIWRLKPFGKNELGILSRGGFQLLNTGNYTTRTYTHPDTTAFSRQQNAVWDAIEMENGNYAVTSASGFYVYNPEGKLVFRHDAYNRTDIGRHRILYGRDLFKVAPQQYLAYVNEMTVAVYDPTNNSYSEKKINDADWWRFMHDGGPDSIRMHLKHQLSTSRYLFVPGKGDKVYYYDHAAKESTVSALPPHMGDSLNWESRIITLTDSSYALSSRTSGFYILQLDRATGRIYCDGKKYLDSYKIMSLFLDRDKHLWVGTSGGLLKQELQLPLIQSYRFSSDGAKNSGGFSCVYRYKDKLYAGRFARNKGLCIINPATMQTIAEIDLFGPDVITNEVRCIEMYYKDTLWIGTNEGIIWYATNTGRYGKLSDDIRYPWAKNISAVLGPPREDGYAWIGHFLGGKLIRYHIADRAFTEYTAGTKPALPFTRLKHIVYDSYGDVWIGGHSLARWNNRLQRFDTLMTAYGGINKYNDDILVMRADDSGSLWLHNAYNGLLQYNIREKKFVAYTMKEGLGSDMISSMSPIVDNKLWLAGNNNLSLLDVKSRQFSIYDNNDGVPEQRPTGRAIHYDKQTGDLYLAYDDHIARFPLLPPESTDHSSDLFIEKISGIKQTWYQPDDGISFSHTENNLVVDYSVIDFSKANYQFAYRLRDGDPWSIVGAQRSINLSSLAPGKYRLQLRALGKAGVEKRKDFSFEIRPPYWKRPWFIALVVAVLSAAAYLLYRTRINSIRQKASLDKKLSQMEMRALQAQMNPHFIFNSLNSIREMILSSENREASHYLSKFAHLIRITLDQSVQSLVSLRSTADYLQRYMEMESIRNSLFTHEIIMDPKLDIDEVFVPPMLIQPFIENAIWHGVAANDKTIHVKVVFAQNGENLICTIDDNGIGILRSGKNRMEKGSAHQSHGLNNIKSRVELLNEKYDLQVQFTVQDKTEIPGAAGSGTVVTLQLPLEIQE